jgi:hypothetical protein
MLEIIAVEEMTRQAADLWPSEFICHGTDERITGDDIADNCTHVFRCNDATVYAGSPNGDLFYFVGPDGQGIVTSEDRIDQLRELLQAEVY